MDGRPTPGDERSPARAEQQVPLARDGRGRSGPVTFLFADVRGFTRFTEWHGAEAAVRLADAFLSMAAEVIEGRGGRLRGTWGDQVLADFVSSRDAVRAAVELQARCVAATVRDPSVPLAVGIGLDIGEPADEGEHQSAAALNTAARLCATAAAGEVLATAELVHLAGAMEGLSYVDRGAVRLKGRERPARVALVRSAAVDRAQLRTFHAVLAGERRWHRDPRVWVATLVVLALVAALGGWALRRGDEPPVAIPPGGVAVVDGPSGHLVGAAAAGGAPEGVAVGAGDLWVAASSSDAVLRLDPDTKRVKQSVTVGSAPVALAVTGRDVWVVNSQDGTVSRISTATDREVQRVESVGNQPVAIAAGFGSLWVANRADATVTRIDARSGRVTGRAQVGRGADGVATGAGAVWVSNGQDGTVSPVDPETLVAGAAILVGAGPKGITVAPSGVWVANRLEQTVSHIDPGTRQEVAKVNVGDSPFSVAADDRSVWASVGAAGALVEIDAKQASVTRSVPIGASPYGVALIGSKVWAATRPFASARHRGGTLTVVTPSRLLPVSVDPAFVYDPITVRAMVLVHDGLLGYRRVGGVDSFDLVPDLATGLPAPSDGGRTYTFTIRSGIRYSDGRALVPADFRRGIERLFTATRGTEQAFVSTIFSNIAGADACTPRSRVCDLSAGIVTNASTVVFHLSKADPEFVFRLAYWLASPVPPGAPSRQAGAGGVLGTGPYQVTEFTPGRSLRLERNPYFHAWSAAAQPPGYPDAVQWRAAPATELIQRVQDGRADMLDLRAVSAADAAALALRRPAQVHTAVVAKTVYLVPDTTRPPFDNKLARRALAVGIDRRQFVRGQPLLLDGSCELLPTRFPGYEPYCPYGTRPDIERATELVRRSGTRGAVVHINWSNETDVDARQGRYVARLVRSLGYRSRLHLVSEPTIAGPDGTPRFNLTQFGWLPDYPAASQYFSPLLSCQAVKQGSNLGGYCNHHVDALATQAIAVAQSDPGRSDRLWRQVYRTIADDVAVVPTDHGNLPIFVSERVGNYQQGVFLGPVLDQLWVR